MKPSFLSAAGLAALWLAMPLAISGAEQPSSLSSLLPADPLDALQKALRAEHEAKVRAGGTTSAGSGREMYETRSYLEGIRQSMNRGDDNNVLSAINQIEAMSSSEDVRRACEALVDKINKERIARETAFNSEVDVAIKRAGEIVLRAKEPKELDGLITDFGRLQESRMFSDGRDGRLQQKIQGAVTFLNRWQEYLLAQTRGDDQAAGNALRNLGDNGYNHTLLIPRSEVLARLPNNDESSGNRRNRRPNADTSAAVADILDRTASLDDIPTALAKLKELGGRNADGSASFDNGTDLSAAVTGLQAIQKTRTELVAGLATSINVGMVRSDNGQRTAIESRLTKLRAELVKLALPRLLNTADERPVEGEGVGDFLRRLVELAKKRGDWASVSRGLEINRNFASGTSNYSGGSNQEADAYKQFFVGLNMEAAGQYAQAVIALLGALKSGVQDLPEATIGEHLAAIEKAHPKEFGEGNTYVLNPPAQNYPYGNPYGPGGPADPRFRRGGYPPGAPEQPTPPPTITVPAVSPTPTLVAPAVVQPK